MSQQPAPDSWRDVQTQAQFSGDWLVQDMHSAEGDEYETWSIKRIHTGRYVVFYTGQNHAVTTIYDSLEQMDSGIPAALPSDVVAQAYYATQARTTKMHNVVRAAWNGFCAAKIKAAGVPWQT